MFYQFLQLTSTAVAVSSNIAISRWKMHCKKQLRSRRAFWYNSFIFFFLPECLAVQYMERDLQKPESTWRDVSLSTKEFSCLDGSPFLLFLLSDHSECRVCVRTASKKNSFLTTVCLTRTVMEFCDYIEIDICLAGTLCCDRYVFATSQDGGRRIARDDKMCVPLQIITRHWEKFSQSLRNRRAGIGDGRTRFTKMASSIPLQRKMMTGESISSLPLRLPLAIDYYVVARDILEIATEEKEIDSIGRWD